jgi:hypothetical protein
MDLALNRTQKHVHVKLAAKRPVGKGSPHTPPQTKKYTNDNHIARALRGGWTRVATSMLSQRLPKQIWK